MTDARETALISLYEADQLRSAPVTGDLGERARAIISGVWEQRGALDDEIGRAATGWRVERMPPLDRNVLRIALWEMRNRPDTPVAVVISEAVRLAKTYSTARSGGFVNGVLSKLATGTDEGS